MDLYRSKFLTRRLLKSNAPARSRPIGSCSRGFALVSVLLMMILLAMLCVSLLSLSAVTLRKSSQSMAIESAKANARMALMIAIGELQKSMGPDQRISARASLIAKDVRINSSVSDGVARSWWVGVVGSDSEMGLDATNGINANNPAAVWLVSGLDSSLTPADQLTQEFTKPVTMFGEQSIDLSMTGGPLEAGIVKVGGNGLGDEGGYAYFIDDEGMKAALAPRDTRLANGTMPVSESDRSPGAYDVGILNGMSALLGNPLSNYTKILSVGDLALIGGDKQLVTSKRLSYTTYSRGVLCNVKHGGLKRDLTAAFENDATFDEVFPVGNTSDYLLIEEAKLDTSADLQENGYIHWDVFRDHYNIKRHIKTHTDGTKYLDPVRYSKDGPFLPYQFNGAVNPSGQPSGGAKGSLFMAGRLGPHDIGNAATGQYAEMTGMPYGDYQVEWWFNGRLIAQQPKNHREFKHSPVIPILQRFQANAWMEQLDARTLRSHSQIWSSHYNPYNIPLLVYGGRGGPRLLGTPTVRPFSNALHDGGNQRRFASLHENQNATGDRQTFERFNDINFNSFKFEFQGKESVMLLPGRSHAMAYEDAAQIGVDATADGALYSDKVKDLTTQSVYRDLTYVTRNPSTGAYDIPTDLPPSFDLRIRMFLMDASIHQGVDDNSGGGGNFEVCQSFWAPFAWENINNRPSKEFDLGAVSAATLNENLMASLGFNLRTTREPGSNIRPLVDANIRCMFGNTRWDSPLDLPLLASYSPENGGVMNEMVMDMETVDDPKGYTYWGAARDPSYGHSRVILFDIPRSDLVSLGQLQHAGAGRFSYEPTYIVGNSYANPRIEQTNWKESVSDTFGTDARGLGLFPISGDFNLYDASYIVNEVLWDRYTFTTVPQVADNISTLSEPTPDDAQFTDLANGTASLPNARYLPYTPAGSEFDRATLQMASDKSNATGAFYHNAGHVMVDGAFNVNSTSVDAWEAFLSGTHSLAVQKLDENGEIMGFDTAVPSVRFPRVQSVFGNGAIKDEMDEDFWVGYRELEQTEVRELAQAVVDEVKKRGPFLSMADFVNRRLETGELGEAGALQAALDATVNANIDSDYVRGEQGAGFPGQLLQGDLLQALAPTMTVRSDTFTIRAYGESVNASTGRVVATAWCEAKVQRVPDPVESAGTGGSMLQELSNPLSAFGRQFRLISFRWLNPNEI